MHSIPPGEERVGDDTGVNLPANTNVRTVIFLEQGLVELFAKDRSRIVEQQNRAISRITDE
jgi:hypothetical protein